MVHQSSSSSSSAIIDRFTYDVFLSFRSEDTRYDFTGSLWKALDDKGIRTFFDEEDIHKGDEITPSLLQSIEQSKMALVVLSKNYASSTFCLNELSHIINCIKENDRLVWPIFYDVEPSDVRWLEGSYQKAVAKHEASPWYNIDTLQKWKKALHQVANLSGTHFKKGNKYLYKFLEEIVDEVSTKIKPLTLHVADYPVGLGPRMKDVISLLNLGSDDEIRIVGIHGIGGMGKTTLVVAVYNLIASQFQGSCYLENVRENFVKHGLTYLQKTILSETVGEKKIELSSFKQGITIIKKRLGQKKVLLLLDDVDKEEQLNAIVGRPDWFGRGSRVIITTRDTRLLTCHEVESKYEVNELTKEDAFELLRHKAIRTNKVSPSYLDVLNRALCYASGHPLALEVIGSQLFNKTVKQCKFALDHYERIPDQKIQKILEVSFDSLDEEEKRVFLDIACVFKWHELSHVERILHAHHGESKKHHIGVLVEKSLIKISESGQITLHDLIADMGEEIVRQESPNDPGRRSRLFLAKDIVQVFGENRGTSKIEMIYFDSSIEVKWNGEAFKKMENLKTLIVRQGAFLECPKQLPNSLRVLVWWIYSRCLPSEFCPKKLVICKFSKSNSSESSEPLVRLDFFLKKFENLRILDVQCCRFLKRMPNISGLQNLEEFSLGRCYNLISIDDSIGLLDKLQTLSLSECSMLKSIPPLKLPLLEELHLSSCYSLESFPPVVDGFLGKLKILEISYCPNLKRIPPLKFPLLQELQFCYCHGLDSFPPVVDGILGKLKIFKVIYCPNIKCFPSLELPSLEELILSYCDGLESFPPVVDGLLDKLKILSVRSCSNLKCIPSLKLTSLKELNLTYCKSLESFALVMDGSLGKLKSLIVKSCKNLKSFPQLKLASLEKLDLSYCGSFLSFLPLVDVWMGNLKVLRVICCRNNRSIPPIKFASLEVLELSCYCCIEHFPENSGLVGHVLGFYWEDTPLEEMSFSFQDLSHLQTLYLRNCGIVQLPSSIVAMSELIELTIRDGEWIFPKQDKVEEKEIPMQSSRVEVLHLLNCNISDESLAIGLKWFGNVKELDLMWSKFTVLPECIAECHFLGKIYMDDCEKLQEIKGIPPNLNTIYAFNCSSLTSPCTSKLLNQELHQFGNTSFLLPGVEIPNWFDTQYMQGLSISFWFRNKFPAIALCVVFPSTWNDSQIFLQVSLNGNEYYYTDGNIRSKHYQQNMNHLWLFHMQNQKFHADPDIALLENKWNHAVVDLGFQFQKSGIYVLKEKSSMNDIRFTNPENEVSMRHYSL